MTGGLPGGGLPVLVSGRGCEPDPFRKTVTRLSFRLDNGETFRRALE